MLTAVNYCDEGHEDDFGSASLISGRRYLALLPGISWTGYLLREWLVDAARCLKHRYSRYQAGFRHREGSESVSCIDRL